MTAQIIDGKLVAANIERKVKEEVDKMKIKPSLATVLIGENPASQAYVRSKGKKCEELGMRSLGHHLPADVSQEMAEGLVRSLAEDPNVNGILVQLPLPSHLDQERILGTIPVEKDVDGFHPINVGRLAMKNREPIFVPCTPNGCIVLIDSTGQPIEGARAVVLGRSNIVGLPAAFLLLHRNATVTICHSRTRNLPEVVRQADIVVAAIGKPFFVKADWIKPGAVVIDVGINRIEDPTSKTGSRLVGDVDFDAVKEVAGWITPVPGGVGPMTIAMLMQNTLRAAQIQQGLA